MALTRREKYARETDRLIRAQYRQVATTQRAVRARLSAALEALRQQLASIPPDTFSAAVAVQLRRGIASSMALVAEELKIEARTLIDQSARNGIAKVLAPMDAVGFALPEIEITTNLIAVSTRFSADLITRIVDAQRDRINDILSQAALRGLSPSQAMQQIGSVLPDGGPFGSIAARAEVILRTEASRVYSIVSEQQLSAVSSEIPGMRKMWLHTGAGVDNPRVTHVAYSGTIVGVNESFFIAPNPGEAEEELRYPLDPRASPANTVNCACTVEPIFPDEAEEDVLGLIPGSNGVTVPAAAPDLHQAVQP